MAGSTAQSLARAVDLVDADDDDPMTDAADLRARIESALHTLFSKANAEGTIPLYALMRQMGVSPADQAAMAQIESLLEQMESPEENVLMYREREIILI